MPEPARIAVTVPGGSYDVVLARGVMDATGELLRPLTGAKQVALVTDDLVAPLFAERVTGSLSRAAFAVRRFVVPHGETTKSWESAGRLVEAFAEAGLGRDSLVVALGGGVVGDLAGFAAAVFLRGVPVVQVPTTLLAQVDSAIGGKTGVDLEQGKNLAGAFWQPLLVVADSGCLATLPASEWHSGLAEVAKAALLAGEAETAALETDAPALVAREHRAVDAAVAMAAHLKARVVSGDEREACDREALNLGHTYAHALEKTLGYGTVSHGAAVADGLRFAARVAVRAGVAGEAWKERQQALLDALGLPPVEATCNAAEMLTAMRADKKVRAGLVRMVLSEAPGRWTVQPVEDNVLSAELTRRCG